MKLKIIGTASVHGRKPGDVFDIETDADGMPTSVLWRKRLSDEAKFKTGAVEIVKDEPAVTAPSTPPPSAASSATKPSKETK